MSKFYNQTFEYIVADYEHGLRLDKFIAYKLTEISRTKIKKLIEGGNLLLNGVIFSNVSYHIKDNDELKITVVNEEKPTLEPKKIDFHIIYEDEQLVIINKPPYLTVHPGAGNFNNTLVNGLLYHYGMNLSTIGGQVRPGIVHRLDKDTSGLILIAKDDITHAKLSAQLARREIKRVYHALIYGNLIPKLGKITTNIARSIYNREKMEVVKDKGKVAITNYKVIESFGNGVINLVECELETGRTHQIRVHLTYKKHPIIGDKIYGTNLNHNLNYFSEEVTTLIKEFPRQALHAVMLKFVHPSSRQEMVFESELPEDISNIINKLR